MRERKYVREGRYERKKKNNWEREVIMKRKMIV